MVRATMPVLKEAPKLSKEDIAKIHEDDKKASFGGPVSGKISQSSRTYQIAIPSLREY
jgi:hypothetical protein